jgi:hypothetical protein
MTLVNETQQDVSYWIKCDAVGPNCGDIPVNGLVELSEYDNQTNVFVSFKPCGGAKVLSIQIKSDGHAGEQVEMALVQQ